MKYLIIYCLIVSNILVGQNKNEADILINNIYNDLINVQGGSCIHFDYFFENNAHQMQEPINGNLALFSGNRFYFKFNQNENEMIQIYNYNYLTTIFPKEEEIQIDNIEGNEALFIHNIFTNYETDFYANIKVNTDSTQTIEFLPIKKYNEVSFNSCIDELKLPDCLKLPNQCKIGIHPNMKNLLEKCLETNNGYKNNNTLKIEIEISNNTLNIQSIKQLHTNNGQTIINIKKIETISEDILELDTLYQDFEIIDLR